MRDHYSHFDSPFFAPWAVCPFDGLILWLETMARCGGVGNWR
jgi:hypothetical protein